MIPSPNPNSVISIENYAHPPTRTYVSVHTSRRLHTFECNPWGLCLEYNLQPYQKMGILKHIAHPELSIATWRLLVQWEPVRLGASWT